MEAAFDLFEYITEHLTSQDPVLIGGQEAIVARLTHEISVGDRLTLTIEIHPLVKLRKP